MFYVLEAHTDKVIAETQSESEAFAIASKWLTDHPESTYDTVVESTATGCSRLIGWGSTGKSEPTKDWSDPCTRGGSVLFGRETE